MTPLAPGAGVDLAYREDGTGAAVVLVHDLGGDDLAMGPLVSELSREARVIRYARRGYGASSAPEPYAGTTVMEQGEDLAALLGALEITGALAVGDGFGALIVLDVARRHPGLLAAAVLHEPPLLAFVPDAARVLSDERARIEAAVAGGGPPAGVAAWLDARPGREGRERALAVPGAFFADYAGSSTFAATRAELRAIGLPTAVVTGPTTRAHLVAAADALVALLADGRRVPDGDVAAATRTLLVD